MTIRRPANPDAARAAIAAALACALLAGCGPRNFENENDRLRRKALDLQKQLETARGEAAELAAKLAESERARSGAIDAEAAAALPRAVRLDLESLSGPLDKDGVPGPEAADVYLQPKDARGRFVPVAGRLVVEVFDVPPASENAEPRRLGRIELSPGELRDAYRSSLLTLNYSVRVPFDRPNRPVSGDILIRAELRDGITGLTHADELLRPARRSGETLGESSDTSR